MKCPTSKDLSKTSSFKHATMVSQGMRSVSGLMSCVKIKNLCFPSLFLNFIITVAAKDSNFEKANTANFFAHVVETEPLIDGHLDDPCWKVSSLNLL